MDLISLNNCYSPLDFDLYTTLALALFIGLSQMILCCFFEWCKRVGQAWRSIFSFSVEPEVTENPKSLWQQLGSWIPSETSTSREDHVEHRSHLQAVVGNEEGTNRQDREPQNGGSHCASIRRLLCDDTACALCDRAALEAEEVLGLQRDDNIPPWSNSVPAPNCRHPELGPETTPSSRKEKLHPKCKGKKENQLPSTQQDVPIINDHDSPCFELSGFSNFSKKNHIPLRQRKNEVSFSCEKENHQGMGFHPKATRHFPSSFPVVSQENIRSPRVEFATADTPFAAKAPRTLEQHLVWKRVQHKLGLPSIVVRSFRALWPLGRDSTFLGSTKREDRVLMRPRLLPFMSVAKRRTLEQHMKRVVCMQRGALPGQVQDGLKHMKLASHLTIDKESFARRKKGRGVIVKGEREGKLQWHVLHWESTTREIALKSPPPYETNPQATTGKQSSEARYKMPLQLISNSQRIIVPDERKAPLPKLSQLHSSYPQRPSRPRPSSHADCVDMNVKYKSTQLSTLYTQSLRKIIPRAPELPAPPSRWPHHTLDFVHARTPLLPANEEQCLESPVIRERAQHLWGKPMLIQESLQKFYLPVLTTARLASSELYSGGEVGVSPGSSLPLATLESKRHLEGHTKDKVVELGWGISKKVMESLHRSTPLSKESKGGQEMNSSHKGKKSLGSSSFGKTPRFFEMPRSKQQVLQRPVDQDTLEISLELVDPMFHLPQSAGHQVKEHDLPKVLPLGLRAQQPQSREVPFADQDITVHIKLNIPSKGLAHREGLSTLYRKPHLYQEDSFRVPPSTLPRKGTMHEFTSAEIPFIEQRTREDLEWHVRKKRLQHAWELPSLVQRSVHSLLPVAPQLQQHQTLQHVEVSVLLPDLFFLSDATIQELEKNVLKRIMLHRWHLPRRILESLRLLSPEMLTVAGKLDGTRIGDRTMASQPLVYQALPSETTEHKMLHLDEKGLDVSPTLDMSAMEPKLLPMFPRARKVAVDFSEMNTEFLHAQVRENLELHIRKKKLQHEWGLPRLVQKSLHGFRSQAPPLPSLQRAQAHVYIQLQKPWFLPQSIYSQLEFHLQRMKLQRQWKLPKRALESIKLLHPAFETDPLELENAEYENKNCESLGSFLPAIPEDREELSSWEEPSQATFLGENVFTHGSTAYRAQQMDSRHHNMGSGVVPEGAFSESSAASTDQHSLKRKSTETDHHPMGSFDVTPDDPLCTFSPLYSQVKPRSTFLPSMESESVGKGKLDIRHKHPEHLPCQQSEDLKRKYESSAACPHMDECFTGMDSMPVSLDRNETKEKPEMNVYQEHVVAITSANHKMTDSAISLDETQDHLESDTKHKKIYHNWGSSPQTVQKSTSAFLSPPPKSSPLYPQVTQEIMGPGTEKEESATRESPLVGNEKNLYWEEHQPTEQVGDSAKTRQRDKKMSIIDGIPQNIKTGVPNERRRYSSKDATNEKPQIEDSVIKEPLEYMKEVNNSPLATDVLDIQGTEAADNAYLKILQDTEETRFSGGLEATDDGAGEAPQTAEVAVMGRSIQGAGDDLVVSEVQQATEEGSTVAGFAKEDTESGEEEDLTYGNTQVGTSAESSKEYEEVATVSVSPDVTEDERAIGQQASEVSQVTGEEVTIAGESLQHLESETVTPRSSQASQEMVAGYPEIHTDVAEDGEAPQAEEEITGVVSRDTSTESSQEDDEMSLMGENPDKREKTSTVLATPKKGAYAGESQEVTGERDGSSGTARKQSTLSEGPSSKEEGTTERESPQAEEGVPGEKPPVTTKESSQGKDSFRVAKEMPRVIAPESEEAGCSRKPFQDTKQHGEAPSRRQAVTFRWGFLKQIQGSPQTFLLHLQPRYHRGCISTGGLGDQSQATTKPGLRKKPPFFRTELLLQVERGGRISICGATKKPPPLFSPKPHPSMVIPERGVDRDRPGKGMGRPSYLKGRALKHKVALKFTQHAHLQKMTPKRDSGVPLEPEKLLPRAAQLIDFNPRPRSSQVPESWRPKSLDRSSEPAPRTCIEKFLGDKCSISWQLESSLQGMVRNNQHSVGPRKPQPVDISHATGLPCVCHTAVLQMDTKFPCVVDAGQKQQQQQGVPRRTKKRTQGHLDLVSLESKVDTDSRKQEISGENLLKPSEIARDQQLRTHIAQRALGSFILPCLVISSHTAYDEMVAELVKKASRERQEKLSSQLHKRRISSGVPKEENQGLPLQTPGHRASARGQRKTPATQKPRSRLASKYPHEVRSGMAPAPSLNINNSCRILQNQEDSQSSEERRSASSESSEASGESETSTDFRASSLGTNRELPDPPSDCIHSETEGEGVGRESRGISISVPKDASQTWPGTPCKQSEDQSQVSNICDWQRAGDRGSGNIQVDEDRRVQKVGQRPKDGPCLKPRAFLGPQGRSASSSRHKDSDKRMAIIGSVLERLLHLKDGMHVWLQSHSIEKAVWREKKRQAFAMANCPEKEDILKGAEEFRHAEPAVPR